MTTPQSPVEAMLALADAMDQIIATVAGYRAKLEAAGFSPTASEAMTTDYHQALITAVLAPRKK